MANDELDVGPFLDFCAVTPCASKERELHRPRVDRSESPGQVFNKQVGAREANLRKVHSKRAHALQKQYCVGHGDFEIGLLQPVPKARVEQLDCSWSRSVHQCISPIAERRLAGRMC